MNITLIELHKMRGKQTESLNNSNCLNFLSLFSLNEMYTPEAAPSAESEVPTGQPPDHARNSTKNQMK